jgi:hypothetical protein
MMPVPVVLVAELSFRKLASWRHCYQCAMHSLDGGGRLDGRALPTPRSCRREYGQSAISRISRRHGRSIRDHAGSIDPMLAINLVHKHSCCRASYKLRAHAYVCMTRASYTCMQPASVLEYEGLTLIKIMIKIRSANPNPVARFTYDLAEA